jgi:beta-mannosidase
MRRIIFVLSISLFIGCNTLEKDIPLKKALTENWQFKGIDTLDWKSATVP